ncbi:dihydrofolate reductase family protein [Patescibacteria group bacterium]|nr:dihydrofolate reductase family protein [Patescibacteria group bacterium]
MNRPETTLFLLVSADGKISLGDNDNLDVDKQLKEIPGIAEGLHQYYELEQQTDQVSLNTGRVMAKIGVNERTETPVKIPVDFIIIDSKPHLTEAGVRYLSQWVQTLYLPTTNPNHPCFSLSDELDNIVPLLLPDPTDFSALFERFASEFGMTRITLQSGGTLNATLLREGIIDHVSLVIAPYLVGGKDTSSLIDGESLHSPAEIHKIRPLHLVECRQMEDSYLYLRYDVVNEVK